MKIVDVFGVFLIYYCCFYSLRLHGLRPVIAQRGYLAASSAVLDTAMALCVIVD